MDPFTQRLRNRSYNRSLQRFHNKNKTEHNSYTVKKVTCTKSEFMTEREAAKEIVFTKIDIETVRVMNSFLHKALGSALLNSCDDDDENEINDNIIEKKSVFDECRTANGTEYPFHTLCGYRAITQERRKGRPPVPSITFYVQELKQSERERILKYVETLQDEVSSQKNILQQVTKALSYCCSTELSRISPQRVECEKLLLLSLHKYAATRKKIDLLRTDIRNGCLLKAEKGTVTISDLFFSFSQPLYPQGHNEESFVWVLCLLSSEDKVMATEAKLLKKDQTVKFQNTFTFNNLLNNFKINIQLFSLHLKKVNSVPKQYLKKLLPNMSSRSRRLNSSHLLMDSPIFTRQAIFKTPDFVLKNSFVIELDNLNSSYISQEFPYGQMQMTLNWDVESKVEISGFLTVREDFGEYHTWERRWCFLEACILKCWNYPSDKENMPPLKVWDLRHCVSAKVEALDKSICTRPKSFLLEMILKRGENNQMSEMLHSEKQTVKCLFSTDTSKDLQQWCMVLSKNLELLSKWKKISVI
ncbi:hypothetical protein R5R35_004476 [Gryllus longicercus]|uniref:PH domain-containing protein n=1 Tax=Gryllus longicercus TaxID=2509291 RepID=A0AAN9VB64_9ORTH